MAVQTSAGTGQQLAAPPVAEYQARATRGTKVLVGGIVLVIAGVVVLVNANEQADRCHQDLDAAGGPGRLLGHRHRGQRVSGPG